MKKIDALSIMSMLCGAAGTISIAFVGNLYLSELLLLPLFFVALFLKGNESIVQSRIFWVLLVSGIITLTGYMISDLVIGTEPSQYLRGWGRVALLIGNSLALIALVSLKFQYLWYFIIGWGVGGVIYLVSLEVPLSLWKLGYAEYIGMIVISISTLLPKVLSSGILLVFGMLNLLLDYRNLGAASIIVAALIWVVGNGTKSKARHISSYLKLILMVTIAITIVLFTLDITKDEFSDRRTVSNVGRTAGIVVSLKAIAESPLIGYGSWTQNEKFARLLRKEIHERLGSGGAPRLGYGTTFRAHSQLLQSWVEGGVFGAAFFITFGVMLLVASFRLFMQPMKTKEFPLLCYFLILGGWGLLANPFGGDQRLLVAVVAACMASVMQTHNVISNSSSKIIHTEITQSNTRSSRLLRSRTNKSV